MKKLRFILIIFFLLPFCELNAQDFNYENAWELVYREELKGLPKSASALADSIYSASTKEKNEIQRLKAVLYQSKFVLLLEEDGQQKVVDKLKAEIKAQTAPYRSIAEKYLASIFFDYYRNYRWRIQNRSDREDKTTDFKLWNASQFESEILFHLDNSLNLNQDLAEMPVYQFKTLLNSAEADSVYRPLLIDQLAHEAIEINKNLIAWSRNDFTEITKLANTLMLTSSDDFLSLKLENDSLLFSKTMNIYQRLIKLHQEKNQVEAWVQLELERLAFVMNQSSAADKGNLYLKQLEGLFEEVKNYPASTLVGFAIAQNYYDQGNTYNADRHTENQFLKVKAKTLSEQYIKSFPESFGAKQCRALIKQIEAPYVGITTEQYLLPFEPTKILVRYKNYENLHFKSYEVPFEDQVYFKNLILDSAHLANIAKLKVAKTWQAKLKTEHDYQTHSTEVLFPAHEPGQYLVMVTANDTSEEILSNNLIQVSGLALLQKASNSGLQFNVISRKNSAPIPNAKVHIYNAPSNYRDAKIDTTAISNREGKVVIPYKKGGYQNLKVDITRNRDTVSFSSYYLPYYSNSSIEDEPDSSYVLTTQIFTDRAIYRPGQEVFFKAILLQRFDHSVKVAAKQPLNLILYDPNGEPLDSLELFTNEFGSVTGSVKLPTNRLTGQYYFETDDYHFYTQLYDDADDVDYSTHYFSVEEYKRPKFEVIFEENTDAYSPNDSIVFKGKAQSFSTSSIASATVKYSVKRRNSSSKFNYRYSYPNNQITLLVGETITDSNGEFQIAFTAEVDSTVKKSADLIFVYEVEATVTDLSGETREASTSIKVGYRNFEVNFSVPSQFNREAENPAFFVNANTLNGKPLEKAGILTIHKLIGPNEVKRISPWETPDYPGFSKSEHDKLFPHFPYQNEMEIEKWPEGKLYFKEEIKTNDKAPVSLSGVVKWPIGKYKAEFTAKDENGEEVKTEAIFQLNSQGQTHLADHQLFFADIDQLKYQIGDTVNFRMGTAAEDLYVNVMVKRNEQILLEKTERLNNEIKTLQIPVSSEDEGGFTIFYYYVAFGDYYAGQVGVQVQKPSTSLEVEVGSFRNRIEPGSEEEWSFSIKGADGEKASAEVLASMYDASLDQFQINNWRVDNYKKDNYENSRINDFSSFGISHFGQNYYSYSAPTPSLEFGNFSFFGLNINNPERAQKNYLQTLRWRHNPEPVVSSRKIDLKSGLISGEVIDETGVPLTGVAIYTSNKKASAITDEQGFFEIEAKPEEILVISFIGYRSFQMKLGENNYYQIQLVPDVQKLDEVVVVGYGQQMKKSLSTSVALVEISDDEEIMEEISFEIGTLQGRVAGVTITDQPGASNTIRIRGALSLGETNNSLWVIDGVVVDASTLSPDQIANIEVLTGAQATSIYGARAANGVILVTTKQGQKQQEELLTQVKARTNFNETAFFFPQLSTNNKGEVSFKFTSPESLTKWKFQLLAHDKNWKTGLLRRKAVTQKQLMVLPNVPRFLREGDELVFAAKVASLALDTLNGIAKLELFNALTNEPVNGVLLDEQDTKSVNPQPKGSVNLEWRLKIPEGMGALKYRIVAVANGFSDGEENALPILSKKILIKESTPFWVKGGKAQTVVIEGLKSTGEKGIVHESFTLNLTANPVWEAIQSLPYLIEFPYECAEQTFARYYANRLGQFVLEQNPEIKSTLEKWRTSEISVSKLEQNPELKSILLQETPWLREAKSEKEQQKRLGLLLNADTLTTSLENAVQKLADMQMSNGGFPWFSGSRNASVYITQHIVAGLAHLAQLTGDDKTADMIAKAKVFLDQQLVESYHQQKNENNIYFGYPQVQSLYLSSLVESQNDIKDLDEALNYYHKQASEKWLTMDLQSQAMIALYAQRIGEEKLAKKIIKSLKQNSIESKDKGVFWKENKVGWFNWQAPVETQSLLIEAFSKIDKDSDFLEGMKQWLLAEKRMKNWQTTKATTSAIHALLAYGENLAKAKSEWQIAMGDFTLKSSDKTSTESPAGYFKKTWSKDSIDQKLAEVKITNQGKSVIWGGVYWQYFQDVDKVSAKTGAISLAKKIYKVELTTKGETLKSVDENFNLKNGDLIRIVLEVKTDRNMEFLHLKDMRASGFEPVSVLSEYKWQEGFGYYESTKDAATHFFIDYLPKGSYVFEYDLRVNNKGTFSNGIATLENMYAPEFSSHSDAIEVKVGN